MKTTLVIARACTVLAAAVLAFSPVEAKDRGSDQRSPQGLQKTLGTPVVTYMNINNISTVLRNNGTADIDVQQQASGLVFPKGSGKTAIYESGPLWGARIAGDPQVRVGGSAYSSGLQPGKLLGPGQAEDPNLPKNRIYRVRADYRTGDLSSEIHDEGGTASDIRAQYDRDWQEWPWQDGAPYTDVNKNGRYDPASDIPGVPGADMTVWFVANDNNSTNTSNLYGTQPMGIEMQSTTWGYAQEGALGNIIFKSFLLINKGGLRLDSMYICQWSDPDLGDAENDLAGCDTTLSLGFIYNGANTDNVYAPLPPPAAGFDFFQGPIVRSPGSSAIFRGKKLDGFRNLPMTAFFYFIKSDPSLADPTRSNPQGADQMYNFMRGRIGLTGQFFRDPQGNPTTFCLSGDPQTQTGWLDGRAFAAGDRRMGLSSGPFTMAPGDTQEIVVAEIAGGAIPGVDRLAAVGLLKFYDKSAQLAYDNFFQLPTAPPAPRVTVTELDRAILLNWGSDTAAVTATENSNNRGFAFQGYNVYQLPSASASISQARKIATFDIVDGVTRISDQQFDPTIGVVSSKVVQLGTDNGIRRFLRIAGDAFNGGNPVINGIRYYFAVTSYSYSADPNAVPNNLENPLQIFTVVPHSPGPGVRYQAAGGDTIHSITHAGPSDGIVTPLVVDPTKLTGHTYAVSFADHSGTLVWQLKDQTAGRVLLASQTNQTGDENYLVADGIQVKVAGPPPGMKDWSIPAGARRWTWSGADLYTLEGFNGAIGNALDFWGAGVAPERLRNVLIKYAATNAAGDPVNPSDTLMSYGYRYLRAAQNAAAKPEFATFIKNPAASYAFQDYVRGVPLAAYNTETTPPTRLAVLFLENNVANGRVDGKYWPPSNPDDNASTTGAREWLWIMDAPYTGATPNAAFQTNLSTDDQLPLMWVVMANRRNNAVYAAGDEFLIEANHINTASDVFTFTAPGVTNDPALAKADVGQINVFPNPYYGVNTEELNKYNRFVTFSHLPNTAIIRIFNLAGVQVREIRKNSTGQFERWDLSNESGLPVGSGLYIAHIEMPDIGATKILKLAVIQEEQILDHF